MDYITSHVGEIRDRIQKCDSFLRHIYLLQLGLSQLRQMLHPYIVANRTVPSQSSRQGKSLHSALLDRRS